MRYQEVSRVPRYQHIDYNSIAASAVTAAKILNKSIPLKDFVSRVSRDKDLCIDPVRVYSILERQGKAVERCEDVPVYGLDGNQNGVIKRVTAWVRP
jgi:hypothetical protein